MTEPEPPSTWYGQAVNLSRHLVTLQEDYAKHVSPSCVSLLETGVVTDRGKIYVHNNLHALVRTCASYQALSTAAKPYSFDNPAPGAKFWREAQQAISQGLVALRAERAAEVPPNTDVRADFNVPITTGSATVVNVTLPWTDIAVDYVNELSTEMAKRYTIAPEELANTSRVLQAYICGGIASATTRRTYATDTCGLSVIRTLLNDKDTFSVEFGADFESDYAEHRLNGLPDSAPQSFLHWAERLQSLAAALPAARFKDQTVLVTAITDAVHNLGSEIRAEVRGQLREKAVPANDVRGTIKAVEQALSRMEREASRNRRAGAAKIAAAPTPATTRKRDPRKTKAGDNPAKKAATAAEWAARPKPWLERPWAKDDGPCPHKDCKGDHWKIHCPVHPPNDAGVGQAKLAAGDTALTNNEYCDGCTFDDSSLTFHDMLGAAFPDAQPDEDDSTVVPPFSPDAARSCVAAVRPGGIAVRPSGGPPVQLGSLGSLP